MAGENISATESRFNPAIPKENPPDWFKESRSISQPAAPKSGEYFFSGLSALTGEAVHGLDTAQKIGLDEEIRTNVDRIKNQQIASMMEAREQVKTLAASGKPIPQELQNLTENLSAIQNARANNKISLTDYDGRLNSYLKDIRARNPGYRDYIDEIGRRAIGYDPANQQIRQLAQDINSFVAGKKNDVDKMVDHLMSREMAARGGTLLAARIRSGQETNPFQAYSDFVRTAFQLQITEEDVKRARELDKPGAQAAIARSAYEFSHFNFANYQTIQGMGNLDASLKMIREAQADPNKYTPEQLRQARANLEMLGDKLWDRFIAMASEPDSRNPGGVSTIERVGGMAEFSAQAKPYFEIYKKIGEHLSKGEFDMAGAQARTVQDWKTAASFGLGETEWGKMQIRLDALKQVDPELYEIVHKQLILGNPEMEPKVRAWLLNGALKISSGESTVAKEVQDAVSKKILTGKVYADYIGLIEAFKSPNTTPERKKDLFHAFFDQTNSSLLDSFKKDYVDTSKGYPRQIPGKYSVFFQLTDPAVSAQVAKMDGMSKQQYKDRAGDWVGHLFQTEVETLNNIPGITWDAESHHLLMPPARFKPGEGMRADQYRINQTLLNRLNHALDQYAGVIKATSPSADVSVEVHKILEGMDFGKKPGFLQILGQKILDSMSGPSSVPLTEEGPKTKKTSTEASPKKETTKEEVSKPEPKPERIRAPKPVLAPEPGPKSVRVPKTSEPARPEGIPADAMWHPSSSENDFGTWIVIDEKGRLKERYHPNGDLMRKFYYPD